VIGQLHWLQGCSAWWRRADSAARLRAPGPSPDPTGGASPHVSAASRQTLGGTRARPRGKRDPAQNPQRRLYRRYAADCQLASISSQNPHPPVTPEAIVRATLRAAEYRADHRHGVPADARSPRQPADRACRAAVIRSASCPPTCSPRLTMPIRHGEAGAHRVCAPAKGRGG
jgi:hypothetical protein